MSKNIVSLISKGLDFCKNLENLQLILQGLFNLMTKVKLTMLSLDCGCRDRLLINRYVLHYASVDFPFPFKEEGRNWGVLHKFI